MKYLWTTIYTNTSLLDFDKKKITLRLIFKGFTEVLKGQVLNVKISREELDMKVCSTD